MTVAALAKPVTTIIDPSKTGAAAHRHPADTAHGTCAGGFSLTQQENLGGAGEPAYILRQLPVGTGNLPPGDSWRGDEAHDGERQPLELLRFRTRPSVLLLARRMVARS